MMKKKHERIEETVKCDLCGVDTKRKKYLENDVRLCIHGKVGMIGLFGGVFFGILLLLFSPWFLILVGVGTIIFTYEMNGKKDCCMLHPDDGLCVKCRKAKEVKMQIAISKEEAGRKKIEEGKRRNWLKEREMLLKRKK